MQGTPILALFDSGGAAVERAGAAATTGYVALGGTPFYVEAGGQVSDSGRLFGADGGSHASSAWSGSRRAAAAAPGPRRRAGSCARGQIVTAEVADDGPRRDPAQPHRHPPAARGAARRCSASHVKQAGSLVVARSAALRLRPLRGDDARSDRSRSKRSSTSRSCGTRRCRPRCDRRRRRSRRARWRCSARSTATACASCRCRASASSCAAARTCAPPATSARSSSSRRAASRRACGASRRSPARGAIARIQEQRAALDGLLRALNATPAHGRRDASSGCRRTPSGWRARSISSR